MIFQHSILRTRQTKSLNGTVSFVSNDKKSIIKMIIIIHFIFLLLIVGSISMYRNFESRFCFVLFFKVHSLH